MYSHVFWDTVYVAVDSDRNIRYDTIVEFNVDSKAEYTA